MQPEAAALTSTSGPRPSLSAEDRFARVVEASPTALVLTARSGRIEMVNNQAERMFGYDRSALQGQPLERLLPQRFRPDHIRLHDDFFTDPSTRVMGKGRSLFGLRKDGTEFPLEIRLSPIDIDGEPMVLAGIVDVTARHQEEREKEQHRADLARSNADLEEFAYAASHDLKAPLRAISHLVRWIGDDIAPIANPETLENLNLLQGRVARMQKLLDGLLAYSRVGHTNMAVEAVDIADLAREVVTMLAPPPGFVFTFDVPTRVIRTHRVPIQVVLENLISNSLKHHDRTHGHITVQMRPVDGMMEFRITDDGPGIAVQFQDRAFLIFQTLSNRDDADSSGIGLTIVKKKVKTHGGTIWIESAPPARGTTIGFTWKESPL